MKDAFGTEIEVGDTVAYVAGSRRIRISKGLVTKLSKARFALDLDWCDCHPHRAIVLEKKKKGDKV